MTDEEYIAEWHRRRYPDTHPLVIAAKLAEETGEVVGAMFRLSEGRGDPIEWEEHLADEIGDVLIVLSVIAQRASLDVTLDALRAARFDKVMKR